MKQLNVLVNVLFLTLISFDSLDAACHCVGVGFKLRACILGTIENRISTDERYFME